MANPARALYDKYLCGEIADVSTAETVWVPVVSDGYLIEARTVLAAAINTADSTVTVSVNTTTAATLTIAQSGSAAGDIDTSGDIRVPVKIGDYIKVATDGGSTGTAKLGFALVIREVGA